MLLHVWLALTHYTFF